MKIDRWVAPILLVTAILIVLLASLNAFSQSVITPPPLSGCPDGYSQDMVSINGSQVIGCVQHPPEVRHRSRAQSLVPQYMRFNFPSEAARSVSRYFNPNFTVPFTNGTIYIDNSGAGYTRYPRYRQYIYDDRPVVTIQPDGTRVTSYPSGGMIRESSPTSRR